MEDLLNNWESFVQLKPNRYELLERMRHRLNVEEIWLMMNDIGEVEEKDVFTYMYYTENRGSIKEIIFDTIGKMPTDDSIDFLFFTCLRIQVEELFHYERYILDKYVDVLLELYPRNRAVLKFVILFTDFSSEGIALVLKYYKHDMEFIEDIIDNIEIEFNIEL